jgi:creatinine amidohydrolase
MMLAVAPHQVRLDRIVDDRAERHPSWDVIPAPPEFVPVTGVLATPSLATEETGKLLLDATVGRLVEAMRTELVLDPGWVRPG